MSLQFGESELPFLVLLFAHIVDDYSFALLLCGALHVVMIVVIGEHLRAVAGVFECLGGGLAHPIYLFGKLFYGWIKTRSLSSFEQLVLYLLGHYHFLLLLLLLLLLL